MATRGRRAFSAAAPPLSIVTAIAPASGSQTQLQAEAVSAALANPALTPEPPAEIRPFLFLGGEQHAGSLKCLRNAQISAIFNVAVECERKRNEPEFEYFALPLHDNVEEDITKYFNKAFEFIDRVKSNGGRVLVHCSAGKSRSPTIVMAYLIRRERYRLVFWMSMREAYEYVKSKRTVCPNLGFLLVLAEYEKSILGSPIGSSIENLHMLSMSQLHVMLVHAADDVAQIIMETVEHLGHECDLVSDGAAVLKRVQQRQYDLIIMDAHPPGIADGLELVQQIRAIDSETVPATVAVIMLSSGDDIQGAHARTPLTGSAAAANTLPTSTSVTVPPGPTAWQAGGGGGSAHTDTATLPAGVDDLLQKPLTSERLAAVLTRQLSLRKPGAA